MKYIPVILFFVLNSYFAYGSRLDSLKTVVEKEELNIEKVKIYVKCLQEKTNNTEFENYIYEQLNIIADKLVQEYKSDTSKKELLNYLLNVYDNVSEYYFTNVENYEKALTVYKKQENVYLFLNEKNELANVYNKIGNVYKFRSDFEKALEYYQKSLDLKKQQLNKVGEAYAHIGIANVFINWGKYEEGLKHYKKCYKICIAESDTIGIAASLIGIGNVYTYLNKLPDALKNHKKAHKYYLLINDAEGIALSLLNLADIYTKTNELTKALKVYNDALEITLSNNYRIRTALIYSKIANINSLKENYTEAINFYNKSLVFAKETNYRKVIVSDFKGLAFSYKRINNLENAYKYLEYYYLLKDSIFNEEKHKQLTEIETKYQTVQKEKLIKQQKFKLEKDKIINEKQTYQRNFILAILLFVFVVMTFVIIGYRNKRKANILLAKQRDEIKYQKEKIEEIHHEVSESINYATRLQGAILPEEELLTEYLSEHFVLFKPKDKVSGDFYWWTYIDGHTVITAADCTGHGVPGAFMSMLGVSFLREIVEKEYITNTGLILKKLRKEIIKVLKQKGATGEQKDGMDMAIISINHKTNVVQFSGANNPLYIISKSIKGFEPLMNLGKIGLYEVKPDKMPIAIYDKMDNFTTHEIKLQKADQLYMFSDGFADQFGGEKGKKFKYKPFKKLLLENADKSMSSQKELLNTAFENWKNMEEQVDDVVILGIKI